jgi:hypothetical protein
LAYPEKLSPEINLLLVAASDANIKREMDVLRHPQLDWDALLYEAGRHGLKPLLSRWLENITLPAVPVVVLTELQQARQTNLLRNLRMTGELWEILELFTSRSITAVPFKGPTLAVLANADLSWRQFSDLDLLLDRRDIARASELLRTRGYELSLDWAATQDARFLEVTYALEFFHPDKSLLVELHWELFPKYLGFRFEFAELRQRLVSVQAGGKQMQTLAPEDLLLYLCAHGAKHFWETLQGVVDVAVLLAQRADWPWESLLAEARTRNLERVTLLGLLLAKNLLGAGVPDWITQRAARDAQLSRLLEQTIQQMLSPQIVSHRLNRQFNYFFQLQDNWRARWRYLLRLIVAPNVGDWQFQPLPNHLIFLYALLRPFRLLKKYVGGARRSGATADS